MSNFGIEINNDYGYGLIDNKFRNMVLKSSGFINNNQFVVDKSLSTSWAQLILPANIFKAPLVFIRSLQNTARCNSTTLYPPSYDEPFFTLMCHKWWNLNFTIPIEYYIFDDYIPSIRDQYGINVFDDNGNVCFSGEWNFLNLTDVYLIAPNQPDYSNGQDWVSLGVFSQGKKLAACMPLSRLIIEDGFYGEWSMKECIWINPNTNEVRISMVPYQDAALGVFLDDLPNRRPTFVQHENPALLLLADVGKLPIPYNPVTITTSNR